MSKIADELRRINWLGRNRLIIDVCNDAADEIERLEGEVVELLTDIVEQDGIVMCDGDNSSWYMDAGRSHIEGAATRLVSMGLWEEHPKMQWYRPIKDGGADERVKERGDE